jgi:hypothetical protein
MGQRAPTFNELLIQEVESHPELYDQHHRVCTDNGERNLIWEVIASRIDENITGEFAKKRWLQMRDRYRKELKMALRNMTHPKWPYFEKMTWLDPYLKDPKNSSLTPNFISHTQCENSSVGGDSTEGTERTIKDEFIDFSFRSEMSTNMQLLENIMAVSTNVLNNSLLQTTANQTRENLDSFSPDSAIASTSEDSEVHLPVADSLPQMPHAVTSSGSNSSVNSDDRASPEKTVIQNETQCCRNDEDTLITRESMSSPNSSQISITEGLPIDQHALPTTPSEEGKVTDGSPGFELNSMMTRSFSTAPGGRPRFRNPPYLVRRGGGMKVSTYIPHQIFLTLR